MDPPVFYLESFAELVSADSRRKLVKLVTPCSLLPSLLHPCTRNIIFCASYLNSSRSGSSEGLLLFFFF